jgi:hypothetical protein
MSAYGTTRTCLAPLLFAGKSYYRRTDTEGDHIWTPQWRTRADAELKEKMP